jgi:hypothetical protein
MENKWDKVDLSSLFPEALKTLALQINGITSAATKILQIQKTITDALALIATDTLDAQAILIRDATDAIIKALKVFSGDAKVHLLVVPFRKQPNIKLPSTHTMPHDSDSDEAYSENPTLESFERLYDQSLRQVGFADGGNRGYARTVFESLLDPFDPNRPQFGDLHAIYAQVWVAGATDILGIMQTMSTLTDLFGKSLQNESLVPVNLLRSPQGLRARVVLSPADPKLAVIMEWENPPAQQTFAEFGEVRVRIREVAIIRSTNDQALNAHVWGDLFGGTQLPLLPDNVQEKQNVLTSPDGQSAVILQYRHDGTTGSHIDEIEFVPDINYYYAIAYRYELATPPNTSVYTVQDFSILSNVEQIRIDSRGLLPKTSHGVKPDWVATPHALGLIPDIQFYALILQNLVLSLRSKALGANFALKSYLNFLKVEVARFEAVTTLITSQVTKLNSLLKTPKAGIFATIIDAPSGGVNFFVRELTHRLTDETDTSAPPFYSNTEYVAGLVMLAGAPNPAALTSVKVLFELLFGTPNVHTPFEAAVANLDRTLRGAESIAFSESMDVIPPPTAPAPVSTKTFNDALQPVAASDAAANVPFDP